MLWDRQDNLIKPLLCNEDGAGSITFSLDGEFIARCSGRHVCVWNRQGHILAMRFAETQEALT